MRLCQSHSGEIFWDQFHAVLREWFEFGFTMFRRNILRLVSSGLGGIFWVIFWGWFHEVWQEAGRKLIISGWPLHKRWAAPAAAASAAAAASRKSTNIPHNCRVFALISALYSWYLLVSITFACLFAVPLTWNLCYTFNGQKCDIFTIGEGGERESNLVPSFNPHLPGPQITWRWTMHTEEIYAWQQNFIFLCIFERKVFILDLKCLTCRFS